MKKIHRIMYNLGCVFIALAIGFEFTHMRFHITISQLKVLYYTEPVLFCLIIVFILLVSSILYGIVWMFDKLTSKSSPTIIEATVKKLLYTTVCGVELNHNNQTFIMQVSSSTIAGLHEGMVLKINKQIDILGGTYYTIAK